MQSLTSWLAGTYGVEFDSGACEKFCSEIEYIELMDITAHSQHQRRVLISGSHGLVAGRLIPALERQGWHIVRLVRQQPVGPTEIFWNPEAGTVPATGLEGIDAVIHLAGASIAGGRWTAHRKAAIRSSRIEGTRLLAATLAQLDSPPPVFVSTSAVGYYGDRGADILTEATPMGTGFLAEVCRDWEQSAQAAVDAGIRVVHPRFGVVVARDGGMIPLLARLFRAGIGGKVGTGSQYMAWVGLDDLVSILLWSIADQSLDGPVNAVGPEPVTNSDFTKAMGHVLHRPALMSVPAFALRAVLGEMADELILASQRAVPDRLLGSGFEFQTTTMEKALTAEFGDTTSHVSS